MNKNGFINIIIIGVVVVIIAAAGYFALTRKTAEAPATTQETETTNKTAELTGENLSTKDWKTYRNEEYGFEMKYPREWATDISFNNDGGFFIVRFGSVGIINKSFNIENPDDYRAPIELKIYPNKTSLDNFIKIFNYIGKFSDSSFVGNVPTKEVVSGQLLLIVFVKDDYGYSLSNSRINDQEKTIKIARQILSTFKFTK